jgi:hypothetical protein
MQPIVLVLRAIDRDETLGGVHMLNSPSFFRMGCHKYVATKSRPRAKGESGRQRRSVGNAAMRMRPSGLAAAV